jgi:hypothetical protein
MKGKFTRQDHQNEENSFVSMSVKDNFMTSHYFRNYRFFTQDICPFSIEQTNIMYKKLVGINIIC